MVMTRLIPMNARPTPKGVRSSLRRPGDTASMLRFNARAARLSLRSGAHVCAKGSISSHHLVCLGSLSRGTGRSKTQSPGGVTSKTKPSTKRDIE
jgi:hypothetical protein